MNKFFVLSLLLLLNAVSLRSQNTRLSKEGSASIKDSLKSESKTKVAKIEDYLIISSDRDTTYVDTSLTIKKDYKFNYLRRDEFGLLPFSNVGQTYNSLTKDFNSTHVLPSFGARARHFNYMETEDINYYHVPTPLTELFYKTTFEQGQLLDAFFTTNLSKQFNLSIAYKGLRSLGKYQHILTSTGNFRFTGNYFSKGGKYQARAHIVMQDLLNQENGGLTNEDVDNFQSGEDEFKDRSVFAPNFEDAESILEGKRFYLDHQFNILKPSDSLRHSLSAGQIISFEDKNYQFSQTSQNDFFGQSFRNTNIKDKVTLEDFYNRFFLKYDNSTLGQIRFNIDYSKYNYGYDAITVLNGETIVNRLTGTAINLGGAYANKIGGFSLKGEIGINISGDFNGNYLEAHANYQVNPDWSFMANINTNSKQPNYNMLLYQSDYLDYNWNNASTFKNVQTQNLRFEIKSDRIATIGIDYTTINNYAYFGNDADSNVKPMQTDGTINYLKVDLSKEIQFGKFALDNKVLYQNVLNGEGVLNVPQFTLRNTFYFSDHLFKKALFLQTGITLNYFSDYNMDGYDPLLAEFYVQNQTNIGSFPRLDFFINAKIRQTRIFLKAEHFNSSFTGYDYFSAPNYPYRDFTVRFGLVWNFFL